MPAITASPIVPASGVPRLLAWTALALGLALLLAPRRAAADDKGAPANTGNKAGSQTGGNSVGDGFRSLGQQLSDPKTLDRIKGHEQEFEKNVQGTRDQQRKSHPGELRASDATDMANDPKMGGRGKASGGARSTTKSKSTTTTTTTTTAPKAAPPNGAAAVPHDSSAAPPAAKAPPKAPPPAATPAK
jgi:hypothetical protein